MRLDGRESATAAGHRMNRLDASRFDRGVAPNLMPSEIVAGEAVDGEQRSEPELGDDGPQSLVSEVSSAGLRLFNRYFGDLRERMDPTTGPSGDPSPGGDDAQPRGLVLRPALLGFVAMVAIAIGASLPSSPFKLELPGVWFFGVPSTSSPSTWGLYFTLAAVYGGLLLLMRVWWGMTRALLPLPGCPPQADDGGVRPVVVPDADHRPVVQPRRLFLRRPGRDGHPSHESLSLRPLRAGEQRLYGSGRPAVGECAGPLRPPVPPDRRVLRPSHLPQRVGHHRPAPPAGRGRGAAHRRHAFLAWPASTIGTGPSSSP